MSPTRRWRRYSKWYFIVTLFTTAQRHRVMRSNCVALRTYMEDVNDHGRLGYLAETRYGRRGAPASRVRCGLICGVLTAMSHIRYSSIRMLQDT